MLKTAISEQSQNLLAQHRGKLLIAQALVFLAVGYLLARSLGDGGGPLPPTDGAAVTEDSAGPTKWTCSMHPQIQKDGPGKCPLCAMDLIPVKTGKGQMAGLRQLSVSPAARALMNIQSVPVERRYVEAEVRLVGKVDYDETRLKHITAWVSGRLDRLFVNFTGVPVKKGDHLVEIYSEELYSAQQELIIASKLALARGGKKSFFDTGGGDLLESTREKLRLWGMTAEQIREVEKRDKPSDHMTIYSPMGGIVIKKLRQEGDRVRTGDRIYTVADLTQVWVKMDAYESDLVWIRYGQQVEFTTEAYPGETFIGRIAFRDPFLNEKTRTVKIRVNVPNPHGKLKPGMFIRAMVRAQVAAGGRVIDPDLIGKWISPMHPEIVKDQPGKCDICGMPLVRAETLGYVTPQTSAATAPLVIPVSAALVTGTRAIIYVEIPSKPRGLEAAYQQLSDAMEHKNVNQLRSAFGEFLEIVSIPIAEFETTYSKQLWNTLAAKLAEDVDQGRRMNEADAAQDIFNRLTKTMDEVREHFATPDEPTFEGREILLGPRAGDYYLVKHGLQEGEMVVMRGNFKIDSEIQIQAKPSMMTPQGGGGGGHDHGGHCEGTKKTTDPATDRMDLPLTVRRKLHRLNAAYQGVAVAVKGGEMKQIRQKFSELRGVQAGIDTNALSGHARMLWKELGMLLGNDAFEGSDVTQLAEAQQVLLSLQNNMARLDKQFSLSHAEHIPQKLTVPTQFQLQLARLWQAYLAVGDALVADNLGKSNQATGNLKRSLAAIDMNLLSDAQTHNTWMKELSNLKKIVANMRTASDIKTMRADFESLSGVTGVLAISFGFGETTPVYQHHCPMAFGNKGAIWLQSDDQTRNPYFGSTMLKCADRVELIAGESRVGNKSSVEDPGARAEEK